MISKSTDAFSVPNILVASKVHIPSSISCRASILRFPSVREKRGSFEDRYDPSALLHLTSGLGLPETAQVKETGYPLVGFLVGRSGFKVNFGRSGEVKTNIR